MGVYRVLGFGIRISRNSGYLFEGLNNKDYGIVGPKMGSPFLGNYHVLVLAVPGFCQVGFFM